MLARRCGLALRQQVQKDLQVQPQESTFSRHPTADHTNSDHQRRSGNGLCHNIWGRLPFV